MITRKTTIELPEGEVGFQRVTDRHNVAHVETKSGDRLTNEEARALAETYFVEQLRRLAAEVLIIQDASGMIVGSTPTKHAFTLGDLDLVVEVDRVES